jgi:hypothetical protein
MKNLLVFTLTLLTSFAIMGQNQINLNEPSSELQLVSSNAEGFVFNNNISQIELGNVKTREGEFIKINIPGYTPNSDYGAPELKSINRLVEIPYNADLIINVISYTEEIISLDELGYSLKIKPNQPSLSKSQDPDEVEFVMNMDYYNGTSAYEPEIVTLNPMSKMRGVQIANLEINPFSYDAESNTITVKNNLQVEVKFKNPDWTITNATKEKYYSPAFDRIYNMLWNYTPLASKDALSQYPIKYVIVSDPMFEETLQEFVEWKTKKGFYVIEAYTNDIGNSVNDIKSFLQGLYEAGTPEDPAPTYVLFVGDVAQIPVTTVGSHVTDMYTVEFDGGGDYVPEMYFGRFSATSVAELEPQIEKTLMFEQYTFPDPAFLEEVVMVAGVDGSYGDSHANGQINYATNNYFNAENNIVSHTYSYPESGNLANEIKSDISNGVGFVNYTAHCGSTGWGDPSFTSSDVPNLQNNNKYFFSIGNCCQSNKFNDASCFGETLLRAADKGAVIHIGGSNNTYWNEDFYWSVGVASSINANTTYEQSSTAAYDHLFHENGEDPYVTAYQITYIGNMAVMEGSSSTNAKYYWEIYHVMGDPSLMPYAGVPSEMEVDYFSSIPIGTSQLLVSTEPGAYVAFSIDGELLSAVLSDEMGEALLEFPQLINVGNADIVVTKQFRQPHIGSCMIVPNDNDYDAMVKSIIAPVSIMNAAEATFEPTIEIMNLGQINLANVEVSYILNDNTEQAVVINWEGDLGNLEYETVSFNEITLPTGNHTFQFAVNSPNGEEDEFPDNDQMNKNVVVYSGNVSLTGIISPDNMYCNEASFIPEITITNNDATPLTSLVCSYVCGINTDEITWSGNLAQGESIDITFDEITLESGTYEINYLIEQPNNGPDIDPNDNTASKSFMINNPGIIVEMQLSTDRWASETTWELINDETEQVLYSDGPWEDGSILSFTETWCLGNGCYTFTIYDSYGDGMSGSSYWPPTDPGQVTITNISTSEVYLELEGTNYTDESSINFCLGNTDIEIEKASGINVYPNPASDIININSNEKILKLEIYNVVGKLIDSTNELDDNFSYSTTNLQNGMYTILIETETQQVQKKIIITK